MNKIIATSALVLTLVACSDNSSLTGSAQSTGSKNQVRNLSAQCIYGLHAEAVENDLINSNEDLSVIESGTIDRDKNISKIYPANSEGFALVTIENINLTCSSDIVGVDVVAEGDTLFVDAKIESDENPLDCLCPRKVSFEVKYDSTFENVKYTKYDGYRIIPLQKVVPENQSNQTIERNISLRLGECRADGLGLRKDGSSGETDKAYLISGENGYQVFIPDLLDYCGFTGGWKSERMGDTLRVLPNHAMGVTKCVCNKDHWFDIPATDSDIKYFEYSKVVYEVLPSSALEHE